MITIKGNNQVEFRDVMVSPWSSFDGIHQGTLPRNYPNPNNKTVRVDITEDEFHYLQDNGFEAMSYMNKHGLLVCYVDLKLSYRDGLGQPKQYQPIVKTVKSTINGPVITDLTESDVIRMQNTLSSISNMKCMVRGSRNKDKPDKPMKMYINTMYMDIMDEDPFASEYDVPDITPEEDESLPF